MASLRAAAGEQVIPALHHGLQQRLLLGVHSLKDDIVLQAGVFVGRDTVDIQTYFVAQGVDIRDGAEDTDRSGEGRRLGVDIIRTAGDIVSSRSGIVTHRNDNRDAVGFDILHGVPDLLGSVSRTARAVDAEDESFDIIVLADLLQGLNHLFAYDTVARVVGDLAFEIEHRHFVLRLRLRPFDERQFVGRDGVIVLRAGIDA